MIRLLFFLVTKEKKPDRSFIAEEGTVASLIKVG